MGASPPSSVLRLLFEPVFEDDRKLSGSALLVLVPSDDDDSDNCDSLPPDLDDLSPDVILDALVMVLSVVEDVDDDDGVNDDDLLSLLASVFHRTTNLSSPQTPCSCCVSKRQPVRTIRSLWISSRTFPTSGTLLHATGTVHSAAR